MCFESDKVFDKRPLLVAGGIVYFSFYILGMIMLPIDYAIKDQDTLSIIWSVIGIIGFLLSSYVFIRCWNNCNGENNYNENNYLPL